MDAHIDEKHKALWNGDDSDDNTSVLDKLIKQQKSENERRLLLIIDDMAAEKYLNEGRKGTFADFVNNARWYNTSIIGIGQSITSWSPAFRDNAEGIMFFNTLNLKEIDYMCTERNPYHDKDMMRHAIKMAQGGSPHDFLFQSATSQGVYNYKNFDGHIPALREVKSSTRHYFSAAAPTTPRQDYRSRLEWQQQ